MTGAAYPFKNLEQAKAVREATARVATWTVAERIDVTEQMPQVALDAKHQERDWLVSVACLQQDHETPRAAAERVAKWVTLWVEVYDTVPTQRAIQRTTEVPPTSQEVHPSGYGRDASGTHPQDFQG